MRGGDPRRGGLWWYCSPWGLGPELFICRDVLAAGMVTQCISDEQRPCTHTHVPSLRSSDEPAGVPLLGQLCPAHQDPESLMKGFPQ